MNIPQQRRKIASAEILFCFTIQENLDGNAVDWMEKSATNNIQADERINSVETRLRFEIFLCAWRLRF
jgi:hypothetical protein